MRAASRPEDMTATAPESAGRQIFSSYLIWPLTTSVWTSGMEVDAGRCCRPRACLVAWGRWRADRLLYSSATSTAWPSKIMKLYGIATCPARSQLTLVLQAARTWAVARALPATGRLRLWPTWHPWSWGSGRGLPYLLAGNHSIRCTTLPMRKRMGAHQAQLRSGYALRRHSATWEPKWEPTAPAQGPMHRGFCPWDTRAANGRAPAMPASWPG